MADDNKKKNDSRYKPGYTEAFPTDMGEKSMDVASLMDLGREAYNKENFDLAIKYYNKALDIDPVNKEAKFLKRKTMLTLTRLLEGKSKVEDDEEVDKELATAISIDLGIKPDETAEDISIDEKKVTAVPYQAPKIEKRDRAQVYKPPQKDFRKSGGRVYSIPDMDKKYAQNAQKISYRSGDSFMERRETRYLIIIMILFMVGILFLSVYMGWLPI